MDKVKGLTRQGQGSHGTPGSRVSRQLRAERHGRTEGMGSSTRSRVWQDISWDPWPCVRFLCMQNFGASWNPGVSWDPWPCAFCVYTKRWALVRPLTLGSRETLDPSVRMCLRKTLASRETLTLCYPCVQCTGNAKVFCLRVCKTLHPVYAFCACETFKSRETLDPCFLCMRDAIESRETLDLGVSWQPWPCAVYWKRWGLVRPLTPCVLSAYARPSTLDPVCAFCAHKTLKSRETLDPMCAFCVRKKSRETLDPVRAFCCTWKPEVLWCPWLLLSVSQKPYCVKHYTSTDPKQHKFQKKTCQLCVMRRIGFFGSRAWVCAVSCP